MGMEERHRAVGGVTRTWQQHTARSLRALRPVHPEPEPEADLLGPLPPSQLQSLPEFGLSLVASTTIIFAYHAVRALRNYLGNFLDFGLLP